MSKIMTLGEILVEIMATEQGQSFREAGLWAGPYPSGAPAIFIDQVAKLKYPCAMIACVGDDDFGRLNVDRLKQDGVDTSAISVLKNAVTGSAFITYKASGERDFIFNITNSASAQLNESQVNETVLRDCSHFHLTGSSLFSPGIIAAAKKAVALVKAKGGTISFDPNIRKEILKNPAMRDALRCLLESTDIFLPSGDEVFLLVNASDEPTAIQELLAMGIPEIVVKHGKHGATYYDAQRTLKIAPLRVTEVDPTGAGDCFGATYVTCRKMGKDVDESLRYAAASGAHAVSKKGPMEGCAGFAALDEWLKRA